VRFDIRNHETMMAVLLGIDDILDEALDQALTRDQAIDYLRRMKVVTTMIPIIDDSPGDT